MVLFGKIAMPQMFSAPSPQFHYTIAKDLLDKSEKQINIIAPRGHAKSSIIGGVLPMYHLMFDEGKKLIVLVSRTQDHAVKLLGTIKDCLDYSTQFRQLFGYWGQHSARSWAKAEVELKDGSMIICKGTGQQLRGIKVGNQRPTLIIVDDPEDENNTKTAEAMEHNLRWLLQSAVPSVDPQKGRIIVIGTPQHERCLVETLKMMKGWRNRVFKPNIEKGISLWEEWWPVKKLVNESVPINIFTGVDPASSVKQTADYSVIFNLAIDDKGRKFALPYYRKHAKPLTLAEAIVDNFRKFRSTKTRIESVGYQEMLRQYVQMRCDEEGLYIPGLNIKENPRTSKSHRLESLQPSFAKKEVFIMKNMQNLEDEMLLFPRGKHDDLLDGLYYAFKGSYKPFHDDAEIPVLGMNYHQKSDWQTS